MTLINETVKKLFGPKVNQDPNSKEFMEQSFKDTDSICSNYFEQTPKSAINEFLFEQTDLAKQLKKLMEKADDSPEKENT